MGDLRGAERAFYFDKIFATIEKREICLNPISRHQRKLLKFSISRLDKTANYIFLVAFFAGSLKTNVNEFLFY